MQGKVVLVTGASSGIGRATAEGLAQRGARLLLTGRSPARCDEALAAVRKAGDGDAQMLRTDFGSLDAVRRLADDIGAQTQRIDVLINNAALVSAPRRLSSDGYELTFAVNHLAPFLLTGLLLPLLGSGARIVNVASLAHRWGAVDFDDLHNERSYRSLRVYGQSKTANILFNLELARRLDGSGVTANCLHPGGIRSNMGRGNGFHWDLLQRLAGLFMKSPDQGATTPIYLAAAPEVEGVSGRYYDNCREQQPAAHATDREAATRLWTISEELTGFRYRFDFSEPPGSP